MTLIATGINTGEAGGFIAVSDILISDKEMTYRDPNLVPLQFGLIVGQSATMGLRTGSKVVLFDNYLLLWSGEISCAAHLTEKIKSNRPSNRAEFHELAEQVLRERKKKFKSKNWPEKDAEFSAILNHSDGEIGWSAGWRTKGSENGSMEFLVAGSGDEAFIEEFNKASQSSRFNFANWMMETILGLSVREMNSPREALDKYGGGYEIFISKDSGGYRRANYSICEVSHYDHVNHEYLSPWFVSRIIQCHSFENGSIFRTALIPNPMTKGDKKFKTFYAMQQGDVPPSTMQETECINLDFGICLVIGKQAITIKSKQPFASFFNDGKTTFLKRDDHAIQEAINAYTIRFGFDPSIKTPNDLYNLPCAKCGKKFIKLNHRVAKDEDDIYQGYERLCDSCLNIRGQKP